MSNETKWTQGEWYTKEGFELTGVRLISVYYPHGFLCSPALVRVNEDKLDGESWLEMRKRTLTERRKAIIEHNSNAHLIAAAPDLYAALDKMLKIHAHAYGLDGAWDSEVTTAKAALAKARGEL